MVGGLPSLVVLVLNSCMLVGGQNCSLTTGIPIWLYSLPQMYAVIAILNFIYAVTQFHFSTVTVSAESVGGSIPGVRVTWNTTVPPECVTSIRVEFRTNSRGPVVANYTTTNTSQTEVIQTGLQCATSYYIRVAVTGNIRTLGGMTATPTLSSRSDVQIFVGGKETVCM